MISGPFVIVSVGNEISVKTNRGKSTGSEAQNLITSWICKKRIMQGHEVLGLNFQFSISPWIGSYIQVEES